MLRLTITRDKGLYYWTITRNREPVCAGLVGFATEAEADADARVKWCEYTIQHLPHTAELMSKSTAFHTPGPWHNYGPIIHQKGQHIAHVVADRIGNAERGTPTQRANAKLIAAAPDLLEACELAHTAILHASNGMMISGLPELLGRLSVAIARAEGRGE